MLEMLTEVEVGQATTVVFGEEERSWWREDDRLGARQGGQGEELMSVCGEAGEMGRREMV